MPHADGCHISSNCWEALNFSCVVKACGLCTELFGTLSNLYRPGNKKGHRQRSTLRLSMLTRMVASLVFSLSRSKSVLAAPPVHHCRLQPVPRIRYYPDHLSHSPSISGLSCPLR